MKIDTLNRAIAYLAGCFPNCDFNPKLYFEMLGDLPDKQFIEAVRDFIKTTKELYPGSNPIAILREKTIALIPALPKPPKTKEELKQIQDMKECYKRLVDRANNGVADEEKPVNRLRPKGRTVSECIEIFKSRGEL